METINLSIRIILVSLLMNLSFSVSSWSADASIVNITEGDLEDILRDFSANFVHTTVSPASSLGNLFGFEVGLVAGSATAPGVERITKAADPNNTIDQLIHAAIIGAVSLPFGLTAEVGILPGTKNEDLDLQSSSMAIKWTFSSLFPSPVDLAIKAHGTRSELSFIQDDPVPDTKISYESQTAGLMFQVSKSFLIVEPYFGIGTVNTTGKVKASNDIYAYTDDLSVEKKITGGQTVIGLNVNLLFFKIGLEAGRVFDSNRLTGKMSFYF